MVHFTAKLFPADTTTPPPDRSWIANISQSLPIVVHWPPPGSVVPAADTSLLKIPDYVIVVAFNTSNLNVFVSTSSVTTIPPPVVSST